MVKHKIFYSKQLLQMPGSDRRQTDSALSYPTSRSQQRWKLRKQFGDVAQIILVLNFVGNDKSQQQSWKVSNWKKSHIPEVYQITSGVNKAYSTINNRQCSKIQNYRYLRMKKKRIRFQLASHQCYTSNWLCR